MFQIAPLSLVWWSNLNGYFKSGFNKQKRVIPNAQTSTLNKSSGQAWFVKQPPGKISSTINGTVPMPVKFAFVVTIVFVWWIENLASPKSVNRQIIGSIFNDFISSSGPLMLQ